MRPTLRERLLSRLVIDPETGCLLWTGYVNYYGYGIISDGGKLRGTHRVMYEMFAAPIPDGLTLDHLCRVRHCANVAHLEPVTHRENILRGEGLAARNAVKTHCKRGHPFTPENTIPRPRGRQCRACIHAYYLESRAVSA